MLTREQYLILLHGLLDAQALADYSTKGIVPQVHSPEFRQEQRDHIHAAYRLLLSLPVNYTEADLAEILGQAGITPEVQAA